MPWSDGLLNRVLRSTDAYIRGSFTDVGVRATKNPHRSAFDSAIWPPMPENEAGPKSGRRHTDW